MSKWIKFKEHQVPNRKTKIWIVVTNDSIEQPLGAIQWYSPWRKYCFTPGEKTIFEEDCLKDIIDFMLEQTREHKSLLKQKSKQEAAEASGSTNDIEIPG